VCKLCTRTFQTLTLIGGIFGIVIVPFILFSLGTLLAVFSAFIPSEEISVEELAGMTLTSIIVSIIVSIIGIVTVFTIKNLKALAGLLIVLGIISLIATNISGIVTWILFIVAGIIAAKDSKESVQVEGRSAEILRERFASGEISKEKFESMKLDLGHEPKKSMERPDLYQCKSCYFDSYIIREIKEHCDERHHNGFVIYKFD